MKRTPVILLLLLAIALGLSAGPHPCHATAGPLPAVAEPAAEHASCHGQQPAPKAPARQGNHDCCDPVRGGHALCDNACQGTALIGVAPVMPAALSFQELAAAVLDRPASPFVLPIDHVPLP